MRNSYDWRERTYARLWRPPPRFQSSWSNYQSGRRAAGKAIHFSCCHRKLQNASSFITNTKPSTLLRGLFDRTYCIYSTVASILTPSDRYKSIVVFGCKTRDFEIFSEVKTFASKFLAIIPYHLFCVTTLQIEQYYGCQD
jgi:hypothetical protein